MGANDRNTPQVPSRTCPMRGMFPLARMRKEGRLKKTGSKKLRSSVSLSLRPLLASLCTLPLLLYRRLLVRTSHLEFFEETFDLDFAFQSFNGFLYVIANYSYLYDGLSPVSFIT